MITELVNCYGSDNDSFNGDGNASSRQVARRVEVADNDGDIDTQVEILRTIQRFKLVIQDIVTILLRFLLSLFYFMFPFLPYIHMGDITLYNHSEYPAVSKSRVGLLYL